MPSKNLTAWTLRLHCESNHCGRPCVNLRASIDHYLRFRVFGKRVGIMKKKMKTTVVCWGYIGTMEKKMETTTVYWVYIGIMEKKMETNIVYGVILG